MSAMTPLSRCPYCGYHHPVGTACTGVTVGAYGQGAARVPHRCPICGGRGTVPAGFYAGLPGTAAETCRACGGTGIVWSPPE